MIIAGSDYQLVSVGIADYFWDLSVLKTIRPKGGVPRDEMTLIAYGVTLESALLRIANFRLGKKHGEDPISMLEYLKEYKAMLEELRKECHSLPIDKEVKDSNV